MNLRLKLSYHAAEETVSKLECALGLLVLVRVISWIVLLWDVIADPRNHTNLHETKPTVSRVLTQSLKPIQATWRSLYPSCSSNLRRCGSRKNSLVRSFVKC